MKLLVKDETSKSKFLRILPRGRGGALIESITAKIVLKETI